MSIGRGRAFMAAGQGLQGLGDLLMRRLEYNDAKRVRDEDRERNYELALRGDKRAETNTNLALAQFAEGKSRFKDQTARSDLLSGIVTGPNGLEFDPTKSSQFRTTAASREAGHHIPWVDQELRALELARGNSGLQNSALQGRLLEEQLEAARYENENPFMEWFRPRLNTMSGTFSTPDFDETMSVIDRIRRQYSRGSQPRSRDDEIDDLLPG